MKALQNIRFPQINKWWWIGGGTGSVLLLSVIGYGLFQGSFPMPGEAKGPEEQPLFSIVQDGKVGYINAQNQIIVEPQFSAIEGGQEFSEGLAPVLIEGKWGYINRVGQMVIEPQYDKVTAFSEGIAGVVTGEQASYINQAGTTIYTLTPEQGQTFGPFSDGLAPVLLGERWGFIDTNGQFIINPQFDSVGIFSDGLAMVVLGGRVGFINRSGKIVITPQFDDASKFSKGLAPFKQTGKWGFINKSGDVIMAAQFDEIQMTPEAQGWVGFSDGLTAVRIGENWGFINRKGKLAIAPQFKAVGAFSEKLAAVQLGDRWGYIDKKGRIVINPQFDETQAFRDGLAFVHSQQSGYINTAGQFIWNIQDPNYVSPQKLAAQNAATEILGTINQAQQAFYVSNQRFTARVGDLNLQLSEGEDYAYDLTLIGRNRTKISATPKQKGLKSYIGSVAIVERNGADFAIATVCQSDAATEAAPAAPRIQDNAFQCAEGSSAL